jgi:hypothetical protein
MAEFEIILQIQATKLIYYRYNTIIFVIKQEIFTLKLTEL